MHQNLWIKSKKIDWEKEKKKRNTSKNKQKYIQKKYKKSVLQYRNINKTPFIASKKKTEKYFGKNVFVYN